VHNVCTHGMVQFLIRHLMWVDAVHVRQGASHGVICEEFAFDCGLSLAGSKAFSRDADAGFAGSVSIDI